MTAKNSNFRCPPASRRCRRLRSTDRPTDRRSDGVLAVGRAGRTAARPFTEVAATVALFTGPWLAVTFLHYMPATRPLVCGQEADSFWKHRTCRSAYVHGIIAETVEVEGECGCSTGRCVVVRTDTVRLSLQVSRTVLCASGWRLCRDTVRLQLCATAL